MINWWMEWEMGVCSAGRVGVVVEIGLVNGRKWWIFNRIVCDIGYFFYGC